MVRKMVGTLMEIGRGRFSARDALQEIFASRDRSKIGADHAAAGAVPGKRGVFAHAEIAVIGQEP